MISAWFYFIAYVKLAFMHPRHVSSCHFASNLALLTLCLLLLTGCSVSAQNNRTSQLTPPPRASSVVRVGPSAIAPTPPLAAISDLSTPASISATTSVTATSESTEEITEEITEDITEAEATETEIPEVVVITAASNALELPTVTPTAQSQPNLLPTPTAQSIVLVPTATVTASESVTTVLSDVLSETEPITATGIEVELPPLFVTTTLPLLPTTYEAVGSFASQTVYTDGIIAQQQGNFTIIQSAADNGYGSNQQYTLRTQRAVDLVDEINIYQIDEYVGVNYTGGDWMLVRRDQGSNIVRAIQPISDLALLFPRIIDEAELVGQEEIAGVPTLRYRIDDPDGAGSRLIQPLLALTGNIRSLKLEVWIAVPGGYVVSYNFQVELAGARVLDLDLNEVLADQAVTWTYQMTQSDEPQLITWPADAPTPNAFPVPGFEIGTFPLPPNSELMSLIGGMPDLFSTSTVERVDEFYRTELEALGWVVEGGEGLLLASREGVNIQLLISADTQTDGTRISVLPSE